MRGWVIRTLISALFILCFTLLAKGTTYKYDRLHRLTKVTFDDGITIIYSYDSSGNRTRRVVTVLTDLDTDIDVDFFDFARFASQWLGSDCIYPDLCGDADLDWSGEVNVEDLAIFAETWLWTAQ